MATNRISGLLQTNGPSLVREKLPPVSRLADRAVNCRLQPGNRVRVKSGTFVGTEGTVVSWLGPHRLIISVQLIQRGVSLEIDRELLERIG